jgi:hypothetical protein
MKKILLILLIPACFWSTTLFAGGPGFSGNNSNNHPSPFMATAARMLNHNEPQSYPGHGFFLDLTPNYSRIFNKTISSDGFWNAKGGFGYALDFGYFLRFNRYIGINLGLGISHYQAEIGYDYYKTTFDTVDIDNEFVQDTVEVFNLAQKTSLMYADVPIFIEFGNPNTYKINFYVRLGVKLSFPISYGFTSTGKTTISGHYPQYFVTLYDIKELGFESDKPITVTSETGLNSFNVSLIAAAGLTIPLSDHLILKIGANLNYGLTEISKEKSKDNDISMYTGAYNTLLMIPGNKTILQSAGLEVGIIYALNTKY